MPFHSHSIVECSLSMNGTNIGAVMMMSSTCPSKKSEVHNDISTILTTYSRAGCERAEEPRPRPYHFPDHHAMFVSSDLNSRDRKTAMRIFWTAR